MLGQAYGLILKQIRGGFSDIFHNLRNLENQVIEEAKKHYILQQGKFANSSTYQVNLDVLHVKLRAFRCDAEKIRKTQSALVQVGHIVSWNGPLSKLIDGETPPESKNPYPFEIPNQLNDLNENRIEFGTTCVVCHLDPSVTNEELRELFDPYGTIINAYIARANTGKSQGYGFIDFKISNDAVLACRMLNKHHFRGRILGVSITLE
jgi:hypothetical protein